LFSQAKTKTAGQHPAAGLGKSKSGSQRWGVPQVVAPDGDED
jgi:hypothetical protein